MSYCVQCGVELEKSEESCPLCATPVVNPNIPANTPKPPRPYSRRAQTLASYLNRQFAVALISVFMVVVVGICSVANMVIEQAITWSQYVTAAVFLAWVCAVTPLLFSRRRLLFSLLSDTAALLLMLYVISRNDPNPPWFATIAFPVVGTVAAFGALIIMGISAKILRGFHVPATILVAAGLLCVLIEVFVDIYATSAVSLGWSLVALVSCCGPAVLLLVLERRRALKEALQKRFHF